MSFVANRRMRMHALSFATAVAVSLIAAPAMAGKVELAGLSSGQTYDQFIVGYRSGSPERGSVTKAKESLARAASTPVGGKALTLKHLRRMGIGSDVVHAGRKLDRVEAESLMRQIAANPDVEYVEVDRRMVALMTPNDPQYAQQWGYSGTYGIRANNAWDITHGAGVVVAVIDTGITNHSDLNANILPGYDFISNVGIANDGDGRDSDPSDPGDWVTANQCGYTHIAHNSSWHGSHVAGTVAAVTNNAQGVGGVAHEAKVVPLRVLGTCGGMTSDIADAITWASGGSVPGVPANAHPAEVINMSLGGSGACGTTTQNAINGAVGLGTTIVVAAGNSNVNVSSASPANCNNVIAVAATNNAGTRSIFNPNVPNAASNYGLLVDIAAPGSDIKSTLNAGTTTPGAENYVAYQGTSMAAPHVAGVVALVQSVSSFSRTPAQVEALIKGTATPFPATPLLPIGTGIVNAYNAVNVASATPLSVANNMSVGVASGAYATSNVTVPGPGNASHNTQISVTFGTYDYMYSELIAPDGTVYQLSSGLMAPGSYQTYSLNLSNESRSGIWKLRVHNIQNSPGTLVGWGMSFN